MVLLLLKGFIIFFLSWLDLIRNEIKFEIWMVPTCAWIEYLWCYDAIQNIWTDRYIFLSYPWKALCTLYSLFLLQFLGCILYLRPPCIQPPLNIRYFKCNRIWRRLCGIFARTRELYSLWNNNTLVAFSNCSRCAFSHGYIIIQPIAMTFQSSFNFLSHSRWIKYQK